MRIGDLLLGSGFINESELSEALRKQKQTQKTPIGQLLKLLDFLDENELELVLQAQRKILFTSMSQELAVSTLRYARQHKVSFNEANLIVLETIQKQESKQQQAEKQDFSVSEAESKAADIIKGLSDGKSKCLQNFSNKLSGVSTPTGPRFAVDPLFLIQQSDNKASLKLWEEAAALLEQARLIYEREGSSKEEEIIPVYCRLAAFYAKSASQKLASENITKVLTLLNKGVKLAPGSIPFLAAAASLCARQDMQLDADRLFKAVMSRWVALLPFEHAQFLRCLYDAIYCARKLNPISKKNLRIGELLCNSGLLKEPQFDEALKKSKQNRQPLGHVLIVEKYISYMDLRNAMKVQLLARGGLLPADYAYVLLATFAFKPEDVDTILEKILEPDENSDESQDKDSEAVLVMIGKMDELLLLEQEHGLKSTKVAALAFELAEICLERQELFEAEAMYRRAHAVYAIAGDEHQLQLAACCQRLGNLLVQQKKYPEAELLLLQAMEIKGRLLGETDQEVAEVLVDVGYVYFCQANFLPAIGFLRSSWMIQKEDASNSRKRYLLELLIKCFEQSDQDAEAEVYREQLKAIKSQDLS